MREERCKSTAHSRFVSGDSWPVGKFMKGFIVGLLFPHAFHHLLHSNGTRDLQNTTLKCMRKCNQIPRWLKWWKSRNQAEFLSKSHSSAHPVSLSPLKSLKKFLSPHSLSRTHNNVGFLNTCSRRCSIGLARVFL